VLKFIKSTTFTIILIIGILLYVQFNISRWNKLQIIEWDVIDYYAYLPATFIYKDLKLTYFDTIPEIAKYAWYATDNKDNRYLKMSMGVAVMNVPSFLITHTYQKLTGGIANGYSIPYQRALSLNALIFLTLGLFFLSKFLSQFYKPLVVSLCLIIIVFGTNMLYYATNEPALTHIYSFSLSAIWLWLVSKWFANPKLKTAFLIGLILGLICLLRPTNIVISLVLIFYGVNSLNGIKNNFVLFFKNYSHLIGALFMFFLAWIPQILYWKIATGHFFFYTYGQEGFFFTKPEIINVLFSFRKGWFVYTPLAMVAIAGIFYLKNQSAQFRWAIILYLIVHIYVVASWWCWWYGGCFGQRSMIESFALLSLPLAAVINKVTEKLSWVRISTCVLIAFFVFLNIVQTFQYRYTIIHWDGMNKEAYKHVFLKLKKPKDLDAYIDSPDYDKSK